MGHPIPNSKNPRAAAHQIATIGEVAFGMSVKLADRPTNTEAIQAMILRWP